jgi:hypothetical protein
MPTDLQKFNLKAADRIVVPKSSLGVVQHHAIYLGKDKYGTDWIAENKIGKGVQIVNASDLFSDVIEITRVEPFNGNKQQRKEAVKNALALKGTNYNLLQFNCEHYANVIQHKVSISHQAKTAIGLGVCFLVLGLLLKNE